MHNEHVQITRWPWWTLDFRHWHNTRMNNLLVDLASNDVAAVAQAQQFVLMQLLCTYASTIHTAVLYATTIATWWFISFFNWACQKQHVTLCRNNTYCNPYYCLWRIISLPNSYQYYCLVLKILLVFDVFAYWKVLKCFIKCFLVIEIILYRELLKSIEMLIMMWKRTRQSFHIQEPNWSSIPETQINSNMNIQPTHPR